MFCNGGTVFSLKLRRFLICTVLTVAPCGGFAQSKAVMAYYENAASQSSLRAYAGYLNQIPTDTFAINAAGKISGTAPAKAMAFAQSHGMQTFATVSNFGRTGFVPGIAQSIVKNPEHSARAIQEMLRVVSTYGYSGVNVDFEAVPHRDRAAFSAFMQAVAQAMRAAGYLTVLSVPAELKDDPNDSWTGAFDFKALAPNVDILQLMTYDENGPWGPAGPVAGLDWVESCVQFAVAVVPPSKVSLGVPAYGYDWNLTRHTGVQVHWKSIPGLIAKMRAVPQWDAVSSSPYFNYTAPRGGSHVVWYEDGRSIPLKSALTAKYNLAGVSVFALGFEEQTFWDAIRSGLGSFPR
jgi:spore germination protein